MKSITVYLIVINEQEVDLTLDGEMGLCVSKAMEHSPYSSWEEAESAIEAQKEFVLSGGYEQYNGAEAAARRLKSLNSMKVIKATISLVLGS